MAMLSGAFMMFCIGCSFQTYDDPAVKLANKAILAEKGEFVGTLPDGRQISRYRIGMGNSHPHWIYVIDSGTITTMNHTESSGKNTISKVEVFIEGQKYHLSPSIEMP